MQKKINIFYPSIFLSFLDFLSLHHPSSQRNDLRFVSTHNLIICPTFYKAASSLSLLSLYGLFVTKKMMRWLLHNLPYLLQGFSILPLLSFLWNFRNKESDEVVTSQPLFTGGQKKKEEVEKLSKNQSIKLSMAQQTNIMASIIFQGKFHSHP